MSNIIPFPSQEERDEIEWGKFNKELEYKNIWIDNLYLHWKKDFGFRAEIMLANMDILVLEVNELGNKAFIYFKDYFGKEEKYIIRPEMALIISNDLQQIRKKVDTYVFMFLLYIMTIFTKKSIFHDNETYIENTIRYHRELYTNYNFSENTKEIYEKSIFKRKVIEVFDEK